MSARQIVVFPVFVCCLSFLRYSISEKPEDCKKGKQYWSVSDIMSTGTCAPCPSNWENCDEQPIDDQESCRRSCLVLQPAKTKPKVQPSPSKVPKFTINSSRSLAVVYPSAKHSPEVNKGQKSHVGQEGFGTTGIWIAVGCSFGLILILIIVAIVLARKIRRKPVRHRDEAEGGGIEAGEQMVLEPLHHGRGYHPGPGGDDHRGPGGDDEHPLEMHPDDVPGRIMQEEQPSTIRISGTQEEHNFSSCLKVDENYN